MRIERKTWGQYTAEEKEFIAVKRRPRTAREIARRHAQKQRGKPTIRTGWKLNKP